MCAYQFISQWKIYIIIKIRHFLRHYLLRFNIWNISIIKGIDITLFWRRQWHPTPVLLPGKSHGWRSLVGCSPWGRWCRTRLSDFTFTFHFHALEKEMATHSSVLAWRIPGMGKPGGLPSMGSHRVRHNWSDLAAAAAYLILLQILCFFTNWRFVATQHCQMIMSNF